LVALPSGPEILIQGIMVAKKKAQETFLRSNLQNEGRYRAEFYKYVKRRKGNRESILAIKDQIGWLVTDPVGKANSLNSYNASLFSYERNNPQIQSTKSGKPFTSSINIIRKRLSATWKKKSVGRDGISGEILKLGVEALTPYLARLLNITMNNNVIPGDWKKYLVVSFYKGGDPSVVVNYRPDRLNSVVCKQIEHVTAGYLREVWEWVVI